MAIQAAACFSYVEDIVEVSDSHAPIQQRKSTCASSVVRVLPMLMCTQMHVSICLTTLIQTPLNIQVHFSMCMEIYIPIGDYQCLDLVQDNGI